MIIFEVLLFVILMFLLALMITAVSNLFTLRSISSYKTVQETPLLSVLVPARNEEEVISNCIESLLGQDYNNFEVIVMDDNSTDSTLQILLGLASKDTRLKIARGTPVPAGWLGKHWACQQLSRQASGEFLLFTDADTIHKPQILRQAVSAIQHENADLISALPRQIMVSFIEKLVMPFSYWSIMAFLPLVIAYRTNISTMSSATGQFMLFRRSAYDQIGGFASVKHHVVDDVELCKQIRSHGLRWRLLDGKDAYQVRQYRSYRELYEGFTKNLFAGFSNNIAVFSIIWLWLLASFCLPPAGLIWSLLTLMNPLVLWISSACIIISMLTWLIACIRFSFPVYLIVLYPFVVLFMVYMAMASMLLNLSKKATWKGRYMPGNV